MMNIVWTPRAKKEFNKVLDYLYDNWGLMEVENFIQQTDNVIDHIIENPEIFIQKSKKKNIYKGFITKHNSLFYKYKPRKREVVLLFFWDNRRDPAKLKITGQ